MTPSLRDQIDSIPRPDPGSRGRRRRQPARRRGLLVLWVAAGAAVTITVLAQRDTVARDPARREAAHARDVLDVPTAPLRFHIPAPVIEGPILGVAINAHHISRLDWYLESVDEIAALGANALILVTPMFQDNVRSNEIRYLPDRCPTDEQLIAILSRAKQRGLVTVLLPTVLLEHADKKDWRGVIRPDDWEKWWASYDALLDRFIGIANRSGVDVLCVGSELNTTEKQIDRWRNLITRVRERYSGKLIYSANWDRYEKVEFWPLLDYMSVSAYFELLPEEIEPTLERLTAAWNVERDLLLKTAERYDRRLLLSEVGYPSLSTAAAHPWDYTNGKKVKADHQAQALCYRAFFESWTEVVAGRDDRAFGFFCYHWDPYHAGEPDDTGYGMNGKPAQEVIRRGFARIRQLNRGGG